MEAEIKRGSGLVNAALGVLAIVREQLTGIGPAACEAHTGGKQRGGSSSASVLCMPAVFSARPHLGMYARGVLFLTLLLAAAGLVVAQEAPAKNPTQSILITHGPVVESASASSAVIAWSTNVSAGTVVRYGTDPNHLTVRAEMPWGGYTHRVTLRNLQSDTTYYFQVSSPHAAGSGAEVSSDVLHFTTGL